MATLGKGATFGYCATENGTYTFIAGILDIGDLAAKVDIVTIERYTYTDVDDFKTKFVGNKDADDLTVKVEYVKGTCATLAAMLGATNWFQILLVDGSAWKFQGILNSYGNEQPIRENVSNTLKITALTAPAFTAAV